MSDGLNALPPKFLTGNEPFRGSSIQSALSLRDYWQWSTSCLMDNTARGLVAEFLVATALEVHRRSPRVEWAPYDFEAEIDGRMVSIEVKSSAYVQSWRQKKYSNLQFDIRPTCKWNPETGKYSDEPGRADIYVFCALVEQTVCEHAAALNTDNWRFRVIEGKQLCDRKTIAWDGLKQFAPKCVGYEDLRQRIEQAHRGAVMRPSSD